MSKPQLITVFEVYTPRTKYADAIHVQRETFRSWKAAWRYYIGDLGHSKSCLNTTKHYDGTRHTPIGMIVHSNYKPELCSCSRKGEAKGYLN